MAKKDNRVELVAVHTGDGEVFRHISTSHNDIRPVDEYNKKYKNYKFFSMSMTNYNKMANTYRKSMSLPRKDFLHFNVR